MKTKLGNSSIRSIEVPSNRASKNDSIDVFADTEVLAQNTRLNACDCGYLAAVKDQELN